MTKDAIQDALHEQTGALVRKLVALLESPDGRLALMGALATDAELRTTTRRLWLWQSWLWQAAQTAGPPR